MWRYLFFGFIGALIGFGYYSLIGCYSGTCPITGNPFISTGYGTLAGILLAQKKRK